MVGHLTNFFCPLKLFDRSLQNQRGALWKLRGEKCREKAHNTIASRDYSVSTGLLSHVLNFPRQGWLVGRRGGSRGGRRRRRLRERAVLGLGEQVEHLDFAIVVPGDDDVSALKLNTVCKWWHGLTVIVWFVWIAYDTLSIQIDDSYMMLRLLRLRVLAPGACLVDRRLRPRVLRVDLLQLGLLRPQAGRVPQYLVEDPVGVRREHGASNDGVVGWN